MTFRILALIAGIVALSACAEDLRRLGTLDPVEPGIFRWQTFADSTFPEDSPRAEQARLEKLSEAVRDNNACPNGYAVINRQATIKSRSAIGLEIHDVFYTVRCN